MQKIADWAASIIYANINQHRYESPNCALTDGQPITLPQTIQTTRRLIFRPYCCTSLAIQAAWCPAYPEISGHQEKRPFSLSRSARTSARAVLPTPPIPCRPVMLTPYSKLLSISFSSSSLPTKSCGGAWIRGIGGFSCGLMIWVTLSPKCWFTGPLGDKDQSET